MLLHSKVEIIGARAPNLTKSTNKKEETPQQLMRNVDVMRIDLSHPIWVSCESTRGTGNARRLADVPYSEKQTQQRTATR